MGSYLETEREYLPYSIELLGIANEFYQGTDIPFNFESEILLKTEGDQNRRALAHGIPHCVTKENILPIPNE